MRTHGINAKPSTIGTQTRPSQRRSTGGAEPASARPGGFVQAKCACGGGCPRCRTAERVQAKLRVGEPDDPYEREADRTADLVMRKPEAQVQRQETDEAVEEDDGIQLKPAADFAAGRGAGPNAGLRGLQGGGRPLPGSLRSFFEPRFGRDFGTVRIHTDENAAAASRSIQARAFTHGRDIAFGGGEYAPHTREGRRLIAHELAHVVQQGEASNRRAPDAIQRDIAEDQLASTPVEQIMADETYFERGITSIEFYSAELAILVYGDGSRIRLGLVPEEIEAPFEGVDYRTTAGQHLPFSTTAPSMGTGSIRFIPRGREAEFPPGFTFGDLPQAVEDVGRTITFTHHDNGRIVPTEVNSLTAPRLCQALREAEAEYVRRFDEMAAGAIEILETLEWIILLASLAGGLLAGGRAAAGRTAARGTAGAAGAVATRAESSLAQFFTRLLGTGAREAITVEGVGFGGVKATLRGTELVVGRTTIVNSSRIAGQGRLIPGAFERAAIQVAREAGARTARVALELVQNPKWAAYLESQGYAFQVIATEAGGFTRVLTKVFTL
jgi:hypothetical protein